jgi:hypothetical protein
MFMTHELSSSMYQLWSPIIYDSVFCTKKEGSEMNKILHNYHFTKLCTAEDAETGLHLSLSAPQLSPQGLLSKTLQTVDGDWMTVIKKLEELSSS